MSCFVVKMHLGDYHTSFYEGFCFVERLVPSFVWRVWLLILRHFRGAHPWVYFLFLVSLFPLLVYDFRGCCFRAALAAAALNLFPLFGIWLLFCWVCFLYLLLQCCSGCSLFLCSCHGCCVYFLFCCCAAVSGCGLFCVAAMVAEFIFSFAVAQL